MPNDPSPYILTGTVWLVRTEDPHGPTYAVLSVTDGRGPTGDTGPTGPTGPPGGGGGGTTIISVAFSTTISIDASSAPSGGTLIIQVAALTGDVTLNNPTSPTNRQKLEYVLKQDSSGDHSLNLDTKFRLPSSSSLFLPINSGNNVDFVAPNSKTRLVVEYDQADDKWDIVTFIPGY